MAKTGDLNVDLIMRQYKLDKIAKLMEIKSFNPNLKQSDLAREMNISTSTLQWYRRETNMISLCKIPPSTNTHRRKQNTSKHTEQDLKMTSK